MTEAATGPQSARPLVANPAAVRRESRKRWALIAVALLLVAGPALVMVNLALAADRTASVIESSLPCERDVLMGYAEPADGKDRCLIAAQQVLEEAGVYDDARAVYEPIIPIAVTLTGLVALIGWIFGINPNIRGRWLIGLVAVTGVWAGSIGWIISHWDAIEVASRITD
ncbi:MAG: hypothetical protein AAGC53_01300 [Actinomycetota bacterium]